jgi:ABC-type branched-subunit amino acid transport system substrate-binding protein
VVAAGLALAACGSSTSSGGGGGGSGGGPIPVGGLLALTGAFAEFGGGVLEGIKAGIKEVNDAGGVMGRQLELKVADSASDPVDTVPGAQKLISIDHVVVNMGTAGAEMESVVPLFTRAKTPMLTPGGDVFFDNNTNKYVWRLTPSDTQLGVAMSLYATQKGYKKAALMFTTGSVAQGLKPVVMNDFIKQGGTIVADKNLVKAQASYESEVSAIIAAKPDVIFTEMDPDTASAVFKNFEALHGLNFPFVGSDTTVGADFIKAIGTTNAERFASCQGGTFTSPSVDVFNKAYASLFNHAPLANATYGYDGVILAALAMQQAQSTNGDDIAAAIPKVANAPGQVVRSYAEGLAGLKAGQKINYNGASGDLDYNSHNNVYGPFDAVQLNPDGKTYTTLLSMSGDQLRSVGG